MVCLVESKSEEFTRNLDMFGIRLPEREILQDTIFPQVSMRQRIA